MIDIDFSELKESSVGRPKEDKVERIDLKPYLVDKKFERRFNSFYNQWDTFVRSKAKRGGKGKFVSNMETFYGEVLEKFEILSKRDKKVVLRASNPIQEMYNLTNLSQPYVFESKDDNDYFIEELLKAGL